VDRGPLQCEIPGEADAQPPELGENLRRLDALGDGLDPHRLPTWLIASTMLRSTGSRVTFSMNCPSILR